LGIDESFVRKDSGYYRYRKLKNSTLEDEVENPENFQINDFTYYLYLIHESEHSKKTEIVILSKVKDLLCLLVGPSLRSG